MNQIKNSFIYTVIFTFVLCFLFVLILSFTNAATIDTIKANAEFEKHQAILRALGASKEQTTTKEQVSKLFNQVETTTYGSENTEYFKANFTGSTTIASNFAGPGLWGIIKGYISMNENLSKITGFQITDQNETPGLGARISEDWFSEQMINEAIINNNVLVGSGGTGDTDKTNGKIDGITGATRTSDGIQEILTQSIQQFKKNLGR